MTSPDQAGVPDETQGQSVGSWGFGNLIDGLAGGFGGFINGFLASGLRLLADLLGGVPIVGDTLEDIVGGIADNMNTTQATATTAHSTATTAQSTAQSAQTTATAAQNTATAANANASAAVSTAQAAANAAADAQETADIAYALSSYWELEAVIASAAVQLGVNELRIGACQNVPSGQSRKITDLHIALLTQPGGMVLQTKKWNAAGTASSVIHTATLGANVTRVSYNNLELNVADKERVFWNVDSVTGSTPPNALQCALFGVIL
ncbi:hypothetical protein [Skermania piniformis]|uniref:Uncharacterized protein n=1 Tax=Skermania pinensis TaxID=39122 RepID=A0ABX8SAE2_9ACTN|nr:hypothetical protein [Skermania piniformis]QXQ14830.1 hypothetical protein KV203_05465 [Skermania piniformis]